MKHLETRLTFYVEVSAGGLRITDAVRHLAQILARVVGADRVDHEAAVRFDGYSGVQRRDFRYRCTLAEPTHGHVARESFRLAGELHLLAFQLGLVHRWHGDHRSACDLRRRNVRT